MNAFLKTINRPDAKRKLLIAFIFVFSYALAISEVAKELSSITAWGSLLALTSMAITAWPLMKDFIWPSGLEHTAITELSLACHGWKNAYLSIDSDLQNRMKSAEGENIWELILASSKISCTKESLVKFKPLFVDAAIQTQQRIDTVINRYGDVLPGELRVLAQHAIT